jgi:hypothetical protein
MVNWEGGGGSNHYRQRDRNLHDALASPHIEISLTAVHDHIHIKPKDCGNNSSYHLHPQPPTPSLNNPLFNYL